LRAAVVPEEFFLEPLGLPLGRFWISSMAGISSMVGISSMAGLVEKLLDPFSLPLPSFSRLSVAGLVQKSSIRFSLPLPIVLGGPPLQSFLIE
jgi:hypothetical protein